MPGAVKKEATTRQRPAGATSTGDGEPLPGAVKTRDDATKAGDGEPLRIGYVMVKSSEYHI